MRRGRGGLPFFLRETSVDGDGWEIAFTQQSVQFGCSTDTLDKDDDLVEFQGVEQVVEFTILLSFLETDVILLQPMKSQFGLIVDINLKRLEKTSVQFTEQFWGWITFCMNFLQMGRIS